MVNNNKNIKSRERPLSPHLQAYKPQLTSVTSILHRASIVGMFFMSLIFAWYIFFNAFSVQCMAYNWFTTNETGKVIYKVFLSGCALVFSYWLCASIRHLFFDIGKGYQLETAYKTGWASIIASLLIASSIIIWGIL